MKSCWWAVLCMIHIHSPEFCLFTDDYYDLRAIIFREAHLYIAIWKKKENIKNENRHRWRNVILHGASHKRTQFSIETTSKKIKNKKNRKPNVKMNWTENIIWYTHIAQSAHIVYVYVYVSHEALNGNWTENSRPGLFPQQSFRLFLFPPFFFFLFASCFFSGANTENDFGKKKNNNTGFLLKISECFGLVCTVFPFTRVYYCFVYSIEYRHNEKKKKRTENMWKCVIDNTFPSLADKTYTCRHIYTIRARMRENVCEKKYGIVDGVRHAFKSSGDRM